MGSVAFATRDPIMEKAKHVQDFMKLTTLGQRLSFLDKMRERGLFLPLSLVQDLTQLNVEENLLKGLLSVADHSNRLALEDFLTRSIYAWPQNLATHAISIWAERTDCLLWHRLIPLATYAQTPQRVAYTMLRYSREIGGETLIRRFLCKDLLADRSGAFLALLLERALAWDIFDHELLALCQPLSPDALHGGEDKAALAKLFYLLGFSRENLKQWGWHSGRFDAAADLVRKLCSKTDVLREPKLAVLDISEDKANGDNLSLAMLEASWPPVWERKRIDDALLERAFRALATVTDKQHGTDCWQMFSGVGSKKLATSLLNIEDGAVIAVNLHLLGHLIGAKEQRMIMTELAARVDKGAFGDSKAFLQSLPTGYRMNLALVDDDNQYGPIEAEKKAFSSWEGTEGTPPMIACYLEDTAGAVSSENSEVTARRRFFSCVYEKKESVPTTCSSFWDLMTRAYLAPNETMLSDLAAHARKASGLWQFCYIDILGRFQGSDMAVLKLLDFIRSEDERMLHGVVAALGGIGTQRAQQELVAFLTRPNVTHALKHEVIQVLHRFKLNHLQAELRSAIHDLEVSPGLDNPGRELRDAMEGLIIPGDMAVSGSMRTASAENTGAEHLDQLLSQKIYCFPRLSSEVKRSMRTAQFFHMLVEKSENATAIDLSPAIDMQYKAMELLFRETFENTVAEMLATGVLQRKLDIIGYARPIVGKMDEFENFIQNLPMISTIPFFSKFKLRKMLQGICQFRPGKRFTLDGLKAFGLFFLCFSRKSCRFGLHDLFAIPNITDEQLFSFVKDLHMFQDFRNRAAHEGFHPDKSNDIDGLWNYTIKIVLTAEQIRETMKSSSLRQVS